MCLMPNSSRLWLLLHVLVWDDLSTQCVPFQVPYFHAGKRELTTGWGAAHTDAPNPACHITICDQMQSGPNVTCCTGLPCTVVFSGEWRSSCWNDWPWGSLSCCAFTHEKGWDACEGSSTLHFRNFNAPPFGSDAPGENGRYASEGSNVESNWSAVNFCLQQSHPPLPPQLYLYFERS